MASMTTPSSAMARSSAAAGGEVRADVALGRVLPAAAEQDVGVAGERVADAHRRDS